MTIDLHGLTKEEATPYIYSALLSFDNSLDYELKIITGRGEGVMMYTTLDILDSEGRDYEQYEGYVIVNKKKRKNNNNFDDVFEWYKNELR